MLKVTSKGVNSGRGPSPAIWADLPPDIVWDSGVGVHVFEDFKNFGLTTAVGTNVGRYAGDAGVYKSYEDTGCSITQETKDGGVIKLLHDGTDNDEVWLQSCGGTGTLGRIADTLASRKKLWFETRVSFGQILAQNFFVGLTEEGLAAADTQADSGGAFASKDALGFQVNESTPGVLDIVYRCAGQALQTVGSGVKTLTADLTSFVKLGYVSDPDRPTTERIRFFIDGVEYTTRLTQAQIAAATFPTAQGLAWLIGGKNNNAANAFCCDWFRFAQVF